MDWADAVSKFPYRKYLIGEFSWRRLVTLPLLIYGSVCVYVLLIADSSMFLPPSAGYQDSPLITRVSVDQHQISARHLPNPEATYTILFAHGNGEDLGYISLWLEDLFSAGFSVFAYDYSGYGTSGGRPGERQAYRDAEASYRYLTETLNIPPEQIIVYGRSLGGGSATYLASRYPVAGLVLESTFTSAFRVVLPVPLFPFDKFSNISRLAQVTCPVLVIHGREDDLIDFSHAERLYAAAPEPKFAFWVEGAGHNNLLQVAGDRLFQELTLFQSHLRQPD